MGLTFIFLRSQLSTCNISPMGLTFVFAHRHCCMLAPWGYVSLSLYVPFEISPMGLTPSLISLHSFFASSLLLLAQLDSTGLTIHIKLISMSARLSQSECSSVTAFSKSVAVPTFDPFRALNLDVNAPCSQLSLWLAWKAAKFQTTACDAHKQTEIAHAYDFLRADGMVNVDRARFRWPGQAAHNPVPRRRRAAKSRSSQDCQRRFRAATETRVATFLAATERIEGLIGGSLTDYPLLLCLARKLRCSCWDCCEALCRRHRIVCGACQASGSLENPIVLDDCSNSIKVYTE
jgi:hypothetical protein